MSINKVNLYNLDEHIAEIYDQQQDDNDDVQLLLELIGRWSAAHIFEPFCGTGRILIPLAMAGHNLAGLDQSEVLLNRCREKLAIAGKKARLIKGDAVSDPWPDEMDLVILGGNCLYELATAEEQESCIHSASLALKPGGYLFLDNDHMEGDLAADWQDLSVVPGFPSGQCADGVRFESTLQTIWFDAPARLVRFYRKTRVIFPDGQVIEQAFTQQKHPVSAFEVAFWLEKYGFKIEKRYGSYEKAPYSHATSRAIFWAQKQ